MSTADSWSADLHLIAGRARPVHRRHPWALGLLTEATWGPCTQIYMDTLLAVLEPTSLDLGETMEFIAHFSSYVATFAINERPGPPALDPADAAARVDHLRRIAEDPELPHLARAVQGMLTAAHVDMDAAFRGTVDRLIGSIPAADGTE